ncbi:MAG: SCO family protein [Phycisphaerales bacterium JB060]
MTTSWRTIAILSAALGLSMVSRAQVIEEEVPVQARGLDIEEKLGSQVPLDAQLVSADGTTVRLGDFFDSPENPDRGKPTVLLLVYYDCPVACPAMLGNLNKAFNDIDDWTIGDEYNVLAVSFDPSNTQEQAQQYAMMYRSGYHENAERADVVSQGYRFFRAEGDTSRDIADSVGFGFRYLPDVDEYAHATGAVVLAPDGTVSRYFYGFDYPARQVKLALLEAADGRVGASFGDRVLLFCFTYDPNSNSYSLAAFRVMQAGALLTILLVVGLLVCLKLGERLARARTTNDTDKDSGLDGQRPSGRAVGAHA